MTLRYTGNIYGLTRHNPAAKGDGLTYYATLARNTKRKEDNGSKRKRSKSVLG